MRREFSAEIGATALRPDAASAPLAVRTPRTARAARAPRNPPNPPATRAPPATGRANPHEGTLLLLLVALLATVSLLARRLGYSAGSDLGYTLGLVGGIAMLLLFLYPLRKRWRRLANWGHTRTWFVTHMALGIAGPALIILHSTLRFGSVNATVAFAAMSVVAGSGLIGRFLYRRIHEGLHGEKATLAALVAQAGAGSVTIHERLAFAPGVTERLDTFAREAEARGRRGLRHPLRFFLLGLERRRVRRECRAAVQRQGGAAGFDAARIARRSALVDAYVDIVQRLAQFAVFERMFSWWHVLHVPLVWLMVASAIAHVVAVHMY